jgi:hypothetical protein
MPIAYCPECGTELERSEVHTDFSNQSTLYTHKRCGTEVFIGTDLAMELVMHATEGPRL